MSDKYYSMSDEELMMHVEDDEPSSESDPEESPEPEEESQEMPDDSEEEPAPEPEEDDDSEPESEGEESEEQETEETFEEGDEPNSTRTDTTDNDADDVTQEDNADGEPSEEDTNADAKESDAQEDTAKYRDFYEVLTKPFRANGKEMTVTDPNDIISLMQRGVNYSQKMAKLKPQMAIIKTLEEHKLTDPEKISYLIDLHNKDPKAIAKLVNDSDIDVYEFDTKQGEDYVPSQKVVEQTPFDDVIEELSSNTHFNGLIPEIAQTWDNQSKAFIAENPNVLRTLTEQRESGLYQKIVDAIEYERTVGRLTTVPYIEAYSIMEQKLAPQAPTSREPEPEKFTAPRPNTKPKPKANAKRKKASVPKGGGGEAKPNINVLAISDEELMALE